MGIEPVLQDIQKGLVDLVNMHHNPTQTFQEKIERQLKKIQYHFEELKQVGCLCRDPERGLIEFPSVYKEEAIFLIWEQEDETVTHWRKIHEDQKTRHPIDEAFLVEKTKRPLEVA